MTRLWLDTGMTNALNTTATIYSAEAGDMIRIDLADAATWPESLDLAALRNEAGIAGDTDLIATLDRLGL